MNGVATEPREPYERKSGVRTPGMGGRVERGASCTFEAPALRHRTRRLHAFSPPKNYDTTIQPPDP